MAGTAIFGLIAILSWGITGSLVWVWWTQRRRLKQATNELAEEIDHISHQGLRVGQVTESTQARMLLPVQRGVNRLFEVLQRDRTQEKQREQVFRSLAEGVQEAIVVHREMILYVNPQAAAMRGARQADLVGRRFTELVHPDDQRRMLQITRMALQGKPFPDHCEVRFATRQGDDVWVEASIKRVPFEGKPSLLFAGFNITRRKLAEQALRAEKERAQVTLTAINDAVITTNEKGCIDYINPAAEPLLGYTNSEACGKQFADVVALVDDVDRKNLPDAVRQCLQKRQRINVGRRALLLNSDKERAVDMTVSPIRSPTNGLLGTVVILRDVTELRGLAKRMSYQASHDPLTGLFNRLEFERRVEEAIAEVKEESQCHVLCYLDLDRFKAVNDTCGHTAGDNMLREVSQLIKDQVRDSDSVARLGGDEFGVILHGCPLDKAGQIAQDVCAAIDEYRFVWRDQIFNFGVSIGLAELSHDLPRVEDAVAAADAACYMAKNKGRGGVHIYSAQDENRARNRGEIVWLQRIQHALSNQELELYTQPILSTAAMANRPEVPITRLNGYAGPSCEVLLRMQGQDGRRVLPGKFLPIAERYQLMPEIDRWVVSTTFAALAKGNLKLAERTGCAINISGQTLGDPQFLDFVVEALDSHGLAAEQVSFELSEKTVMRNLSQTHRFIEVLHGMGCRFGLDDFGSGAGALNNLKNLAMDYIKLDGPIVANFSEPVNQAIVHAMVDLARTLGVMVIAEQVEDRKIVNRLRQLGVQHFQGFAIAYPMPIYQRQAVH